MRYYCTYFDRHYLSRGLALHRSLLAHAADFELVVLCMDVETQTQLRGMALPRMRLLPLANLLNRYPSLERAHADRSRLEFYFTCTSWLMHDLLAGLPAGELLTYLDADLFFFSSPQPVFEEIGSASVAITPHHFPESLRHLERYGRFNVGWVSCRHDATGLACVADWAAQCAEWCFNQLEAERYADQKYLDAWPERYPGTVSLAHPGVNAAPWNIKDRAVSGSGSAPLVNGQPLICYHFHALAHLGRQLYDPSLHKYDATLGDPLRELVYRPYLRQLRSQETIAPGDEPDLIPPVAGDDPRSSLGMQHLLSLLQRSELDRAQRLHNLQIIGADRDLARADLEKNVAYLKAVQKDSDDRLASIHFYQEKLQTAYADLERNLAYLKTLEAEIQAHIKAHTEKDAIIAALQAQPRSSPPTAP